LNNILRFLKNNNKEHSPAILDHIKEMLTIMQTETDEMGLEFFEKQLKTWSVLTAFNIFTTKCWKLRISCYVGMYKFMQEMTWF